MKEEHATVCSHIGRSSALRTSLGTISRERRDASNECVKNDKPGPADYYTIDLHAASRPLTAQKCHSIAHQHFNKAVKDTMKVSVYDHAYERSYKNDIGPGPAAYSEVYQ